MHGSARSRARSADGGGTSAEAVLSILTGKTPESPNPERVYEVASAEDGTGQGRVGTVFGPQLATWRGLVEAAAAGPSARTIPSSVCRPPARCGGCSAP